ncbi:semaphorin-7A [Hippocampus zosterae]|uniref:semaphorin-7A n=1 Tax=Hippocampus zosterae TaxID=109293 RepID=UPI00223DC56D|nr:semaphorin-7A [Hippocampus zosterae]
MSAFLPTLYFIHHFSWLLSCVNSLDPTLLPRMTFTQDEIALKSVILPGEIRKLLHPERDHGKLMAVGKKHLISLSFLHPPKTPVERKLLWSECLDAANECSYDVVLAHEREDTSRVFVCGTDGAETLCCDIMPSADPPVCIPADDLESMRGSIRNFILKDAEHSALVESETSSSLYVTYSGSQEYVGVHKFGKNRVGPANHDKEQHYLGLVTSRRRNEPLQDKVYAFYKEKNKDLNGWSSTWLPYVSQYCMADVGGPKNNLQFTWTSQMSARLLCGDPKSKQIFFEMVDIATVHAEQWQDTRVYALFRNEWNMSAVCVYSSQDIQDVFTNSPFKGADNQRGRSRECVSDSTHLSMDVLRMTQINSEMEEWVRPMKKSGPLLISHHMYTHIRADAAFKKENTLLFLTRNCGGVDKVLESKSAAFIIAEYRPFAHRAHIDSIIHHPSSKKLYISSRAQLVQMDVADCDHYGDTCEECVLARDPYCAWDGTGCAVATPTSGSVVQDVNSGNYHLCSSLPSHHTKKVVNRSTMPEVAVALPHGHQYFLPCPAGSRHAHYSWHHNDGGATPCAWSPYGCLLLINDKREGAYTCVSEERGFSRVLARYAVHVTGSAASTRPTFWICALAALIRTIT